MIGIFDSGLGGLTVLKEIQALRPNSDLFYLGDTRFLPYGTKSPELVQERALWCGQYLEEQGAEAVVIACNTASACALDLLENKLSVPVIGVIKPLVARLPKMERIGILATPTTIATQAYQREIAARQPSADIIAVAAPELVEMVESRTRDRKLLKNILAPLRGVNALILGCTHFPFLEEMIAEELGEVALLHSGAPCARHLNSFLPDEGGTGRIFYTVTNSPQSSIII